MDRMKERPDETNLLCKLLSLSLFVYWHMFLRINFHFLYHCRSISKALIEEGAVNLVVPGNLPLGCVPAYLTTYQGSNQSNYNPRTGCMDAFNAFSEYHNQMLIRALQTLRKKYPQARIMYADFYAASIGFYYTPKLYGKVLPLY